MEVSIVEGDLLDQPTESIVNPWNRNVIPFWLLIPHGVSGAIKKRAGLAPFFELGAMGPIPLGHAVITSGGRLPYKRIVHVASISMLWRASRESIHDSVVNAMALADRENLKSLAFPILGAGSGSFHAGEAEKIMLEAFQTLDVNIDVRIVRFQSK